MARRRRGPPWGLIGIVFAVVTVGAMGMALFSGAGVQAPEDKGVCWRMSMQGEKPRFDRLAKDILNLETCAAHLERIHLMGTAEVSGAFQGRYIFIDSDKITSASRLDGSRWRVFFTPQRAALDRSLRQGGRPPQVVLATPS